MSRECPNDERVNGGEHNGRRMTIRHWVIPYSFTPYSFPHSQRIRQQRRERRARLFPDGEHFPVIERGLHSRGPIREA